MVTQADLLNRSILNTDIPTLENYYTGKLPSPRGTYPKPYPLKKDGEYVQSHRFAPDDTPGLQNIIGMGRLPSGFGDYANGLIVIYTTTELGGRTVHEAGNYNTDNVTSDWTVPLITVRCAIHKPTPLVSYASGWVVIPDFKLPMENNGAITDVELAYNVVDAHPGYAGGADTYASLLPFCAVSTQRLGDSILISLCPASVLFPFLVFTGYDTPNSSGNLSNLVVKIESDLSFQVGYSPFIVADIFATDDVDPTVVMTGGINGGSIYSCKFSSMIGLNNNIIAQDTQTIDGKDYAGLSGHGVIASNVQFFGPQLDNSTTDSNGLATVMLKEYEGITKYGTPITILVHPWRAGNYGYPEVWTFVPQSDATMKIYSSKFAAGQWHNPHRGYGTPAPGYSFTEAGNPLQGVAPYYTLTDDSDFMAKKTANPKRNPKGYGIDQTYYDADHYVGKIGPFHGVVHGKGSLNKQGIIEMGFRVVRDVFIPGALHLVAIDLFAGYEQGALSSDQLILTNAIWYATSHDDGATWTDAIRTSQVPAPRDATKGSYKQDGYVAQGGQGLVRFLSTSFSMLALTYDNIPLTACVDYWNYYDKNGNKIPFWHPTTTDTGAHLSFFAFTDNLGVTGSKTDHTTILFSRSKRV